MSSADLLSAVLQNYSSRTALTLCEGAEERLRWSFDELQQERCRVAASLQQLGLGKGDSIVVMLDRAPHFIALFLASLQLDCCFVPLPLDISGHLLASVMASVQPAVVIVDAGLSLRTLRAVLGHPCHVLRFCGDREPWLNRFPGSREQPDYARPVSAAAQPDDKAVLLLFSSGSTGEPKAIFYTRATLNIFLQWQAQLFAAFPDRRKAGGNPMLTARINALPLCHWGGLSFCLQTLIDGRSLHLLAQASAQQLLLLAARTGCELLLLVPALYAQLAELEPTDTPALNLRYLLCLGEAAPEALRQKIETVYAVQMYSVYGMSEGLSGLGHRAAASQTRRCNDEDADTARNRLVTKKAPSGSCGELLFGEVKLLDGVGQESLQEGELWVRNATTTPCYQAAALNAAKFRNGWYRTGDLFRRDPDGWFYYQGRVDAMCISNGINIYPAEVERVLLQHSEVTDALVLPLVSRTGKQGLGALVCSKADSAVNREQVMDFYLAHGAVHAVPVWIVVCKAMPLLASGKHDRLASARLLQQEYEAHQVPVSSEPLAVCLGTRQ